MRLKILVPAVALLLLIGGVGVSAAPNSNNGIPKQLAELQTTVSNLVIEVKDLLTLKDEVKSLKDELAVANTTISEQQTEIDSMKQLNEKLLSKFTQNERGDLYFEDKLIVKKDIEAPEAISNLRVVNATPSKVKITFDPSISTDIANYRIELGHVMDGEITTHDIGTNTEYVFTGLNLSNPDPNYYVKVIAIDGHDNASDSTDEYFEVIPHIPPVLANAHVQWGTYKSGVELWIGDIKYADSFDVYVDGELLTTFQGNEGYYFLDNVPRNTKYVIKLVAKNKYGTSEKDFNISL
ncbi:hypothetical protein AV656_10525 [Bhargavaea cecembensis]|uniref:Fibronectin type-III domain-containing protein n=1 Tax=Bhargavaea cecembensis TaxID=394098 RepID=A0A163ERD0_9BACL|nr:fibronectin type III domain-containing protein [Bhargavaea cecembensis]KZE37011.1 hypothetical protein AV656_10525 [Bhargavaea cecembensis]